MKTKAICSFFVLFAIVSGIGATTPDAFADPHAIDTADNDLGTPAGAGPVDEVYVKRAPHRGGIGVQATDERHQSDGHQKEAQAHDPTGDRALVYRQECGRTHGCTPIPFM